MRPAKHLFLSMRLLRRDWRAGELRILVAALVIAVAAATVVSFFSERLGRALVHQSAELLGADLALVSPRPVNTQWLAQARQYQLKVAETLEFPSVVLYGQQTQLVSVKAVSAPYPLRGFLRTSLELQDTSSTGTHVPKTGNAWVQARLLHALGINIGATIEIGEASFTITRILSYEPGQIGNFFGAAPRVLIHQADVARTGVVQPGSRVSYQYLFAGKFQDVSVYKKWLQSRLETSHRLLDVYDGRPAIGNALDRAERYLGLATLVAVILAAVAVAMGARRYSERHFDVSAIMRCFGATQNGIVWLYIPQLLAVGIGAAAVGCVLGWLAQHGLFYLLKDLMPAVLPAAGMKPIAIGFFTGLVTLVGFALPPVVRLRRVPPLRVLRRDLSPLPVSGWVVYGLALAVFVLLLWRHTGDIKLTAIVLGGAAIVTTASAGLAFALLSWARRLHEYAGVTWRFGLSNLWRRSWTSVGQILAFGLTLMAMAVIILVRTDLLSTWQTQLPGDAPNHFAINILPQDTDSVQQFFAEHNIESTALYPMVRGRLVAINDVPVRQAVSKEDRDHNSLNRELNLTWTDSVPSDNAIVAGRWWHGGAPGKKVVSVEQRLAQRLNISVEDKLRFSIGGQEFSARVQSIRSVQWDSFHPNFYMIFPPGVLDAYPATYITSFYLSDQQKSVLAALVRVFPSVTVLELDQIMAQVRAILTQVTLAVEYILVFVLLAGFAVLYAALKASLDERLYEGALLRTLGANRHQLRVGHAAEFAALGLLAGLLAAIGTEIIAYLLYSKILHLPYQWKWPVWVLAPPVGATLIGMAGYWGTRPVLNQSPLTVMRDL